MVKRITSKDIADLAGVSRTTVSFVLNNVPGMRIPDETRKRVLEAARQLNYHPHAAARSMASGRTNVLGLVMRQSTDQALADQFLPQVLNGINIAASAQGYRVLFESIPPEETDDVYTKLIREHHVDGIILSGPRLDDQDLLRLYADGAPVVMMGQLPETDIPFVDIDNVGGAALATQHLIGLGHQRIGLITNASPLYTSSADRQKGYKDALQAAGLPIDPALIHYGNMTPQSGEIAMNELLALEPRPTGIFIASDTVALGALQALRKHHLSVPKDIAIVGFDDIPLSAYVDPPLTTVHLPAYGIGWGAADLLIRLIGGDEPPSSLRVLLETELVVRDSCGTQFNKHNSH